ncbi:MAG: plasmid mobilization relaxosome protein MobC [Candidatus Malihini olakiniferum]
MGNNINQVAKKINSNDNLDNIKVSEKTF